MTFKLSFNLDPRIGDPYEFVKEARAQGVPIDYLTVENAIAKISRITYLQHAYNRIWS